MLRMLRLNKHYSIFFGLCLDTRGQGPDVSGVASEQPRVNISLGNHKFRINPWATESAA